MTVSGSAVLVKCDHEGCEEQVMQILGVAQCGMGPPFKWSSYWLAAEIAKQGWRTCGWHGHLCPKHPCAEFEPELPKPSDDPPPSGRPN